MARTGSGTQMTEQEVLNNSFDDDLSGLGVTQLSALAGEDITNNVMRTEVQLSSTRVTADGQIKATAGFLGSIAIAPITATPTAGLLTIYDSAAESGTVIYTEWVFATTPGHSINLNRICVTGIYVGYDATLANVQVTANWR